MPAKTPKDPDFFVVGLQKSGTFWVTALLDAHPEVRCLAEHIRHGFVSEKTGAAEGHIFDMFASFDEDGGAALKHSLTNYHDGFFKNIVPLIEEGNKKEVEEALKARYREWLAFQNKEGKPIVGDKTTEYIFHLALIDAWYPRVKKICILRNPKDRIVSWHFHEIRKGRKKTQAISDAFVEDYITERVKSEYEHMLAYNGYIHCLTYETFSMDPEPVVRKMFSYLGVSEDSAVVQKAIRNASIETSRTSDPLIQDNVQKEQGVAIPQSHYRKGVVGDWKNHLTRSQAHYVGEALNVPERAVFRKYGIRRPW